MREDDTHSLRRVIAGNPAILSRLAHCRCDELSRDRRLCVPASQRVCLIHVQYCYSRSSKLGIRARLTH
jgi:hypothetical protein